MALLLTKSDYDGDSGTDPYRIRCLAGSTAIGYKNARGLSASGPSVWSLLPLTQMCPQNARMALVSSALRWPLLTRANETAKRLALQQPAEKEGLLPSSTPSLVR